MDLLISSEPIHWHATKQEWTYGGRTVLYFENSEGLTRNIIMRIEIIFTIYCTTQ